MILIAMCDDNEKELSELELITRQVMQKYAFVFDIKKFNSGEKFLQSKLKFHIIFLDIKMGKKTGIEIGKEVYRKNHRVKIIFQTSYSQYCKVAMNQTHAFAFLEKPLKLSEVEEQILEFMKGHEINNKIMVEFQNVRNIIDSKENVKHNLIISVENIICFIYIKSHREIKIVTENKDFIFKETMYNLEEKMIPHGFTISCRGILVNIAKVKSIKRYSIELSNGFIVPLSQKRVVEFKERINEYLHISFN